MSYRNAINLSDPELDQPIYRIMPAQRLLQMLSNRKMVLVKPKKWDDPFENSLLSAIIKTSDGMTGEFSMKDQVYGQCWTTHEETDAMWRIYSYEKQGIKVKTTPRKLLDSLMNATPHFGEIRCFIGKVAYYQESELFEKLNCVNWRATDGSGIAESLLYKREEFSHESEIRLIYSAPESESVSDLYTFDIDPMDLFDELVFDPRMDASFVHAFKLAITNYGFNKKTFQSSLYQSPKQMVVHV